RGTARPQDGDNNGSFLYDVGAFELNGALPSSAFLTIGDVTLAEGDAGTVNAVFVVTRSGSTTDTVSVDFVTANGTAIAGEDYTTTSGTLFFAPGETTQTIAVAVLGDTVAEPDESFTVNLASATNATIVDGQGVGTIVNDDEDIVPIPPQPSPTPPQPSGGALVQPFLGTFQATGAIALEVNLTSYKGAGISDIGLFLVDDDQGSIDGILPGAAGYSTSALQRARTVFSALNAPPSNFAPNSRTLTLGAGDRIRFLLVENGTLDALRLGKNPTGAVILSGSNGFTTTQTGNGYTLDWNTRNRRLSLNLGAVGVSGVSGIGTQDTTQGELIDLREVATSTEATFTLFRAAAFENTLGLYRVQNERGAVLDTLTGTTVLPGETGYLQAALRNRVEGIAFAVSNNTSASFTATLDGNTLYAPFLVANGTMEAAIAGATIYTPFIGANTDGVDHVRLLGDNTFGFEDLLGGGDFDYNDMVVRVSLG
ncbi:MAG: DUF4114 domain-containing protein, partial [Cyanobacteria bacterium Co-bin8]|nr:DUF4114 domain-containing protein [Cyanobacteria bacterium Co-bin8]